MLLTQPSSNASSRLSSTETPEQVARHEVPPGFRSSCLRRGWAGGPGEGGLHRVRAVLREKRWGTSIPQPSSASPSSLLPPAASQQGPLGWAQRHVKTAQTALSDWTEPQSPDPKPVELTEGTDGGREHLGWFKSSCWGWILLGGGLYDLFSETMQKMWTDISTLWSVGCPV